MGRSEQVTAGQNAGQPPVWDNYGRLSWRPDTGDLEKIEDQWSDNAKVIERAGAQEGKRLSDGASAWKRGTRRPGWDEILERLRTGVSQGVVVWNTDRLLRCPWDLEVLIDMGDDGYRIASSYGEYDLSNADHRFILRIKTAQAAKESDDKSRRVKRRFEGLRERGVVHPRGRRFGWPGRDLTWTPGEGETDEDRPLVSAELVNRERAAIRDAAPALLAKISQGQIAAEWNEAGLVTAEGRQWISITVREVMKRPSNAGLIEHDGQVCGRIEGEPILDEETFERLRAMFAGRRRGRPAGVRYMATGLVLCRVCLRPLTGHPATGVYPDTGERRRTYFCSKQNRGCGTVYADMRAVDQLLREFTLDRLSDVRHASAIESARREVSARLDVVKAEIAECEEIQEALSDRLGRREIKVAAFDKANAPLVKSLDKLTEERDRLDEELSGMSGPSAHAPSGAVSREELAARWDNTEDPSERRAMLASALRKLRPVIAPPRRKRERGFDTDRLQFEDPATLKPTWSEAS